MLEGIACSWNGKGGLDALIRSVRSDSRKVQPGDLFVAVPGSHVDGHRFIEQALQSGAKAIVSERFDRKVQESGLPQFVVSDSRLALSRLTASSYDFPAEKLNLIGITGTNGKSTTAFLIQHLLNQASKAGLIGTILCDDGNSKEQADYMTPGPEFLNEMMARMVANGLRYCVMEVSSHALDQERVRELAFSSVVFTNLTQDHLDYHGNFELYYQAKRKLFFGPEAPRHSIINEDDPYGVRLKRELGTLKSAVSYGLEKGDFVGHVTKVDWTGVEFKLKHGANRWVVSAPLLLQHNVYNLTAALVTLHQEGFNLTEMIPSLLHFPGVSGRMERIDEGQNFRVFVDYAHTPDGLLNVLRAVGTLPKRRVITVFGCGGDRDRTKRPVMGEIAGRESDLAILTSDNPRTEDPELILDEVETGFRSTSSRAELIREPDRKEAIRRAIELAQEGDVLLIFGKGHEDYQILGTKRLPFSDQEVVRHWLKEKCLRSGKSQRFAVER